jgi:hypothetical protein
MSVDFEKLADAGLPPDDQDRRRKSPGKWLLLLLLVLLLGTGYWAYTHFFAAGEEPEITPTAELLIVREGETPEPGVLPHKIDTATEFPDSLDTLREGIREPKVRDTEEGQKSVGLVTGDESPKAPASLMEKKETPTPSPAAKEPKQERTPVEATISDDSPSAERLLAMKDLQTEPTPEREVTTEQGIDEAGVQDQPSSPEVNRKDTVELPSEETEEVILEAVIEVDSVGMSVTPPIQPGASAELKQAGLDDLTFDVPDMERDWGGLILVPDNVQLSRAFSTTVSLARIEAHPLEDGRLRVWMRIVNETDDALSIRVNCSFSGSQNQLGGVSRDNLTLPEGASLDTTFISPFRDVKAYTILVKRLF